MIKILVFYIVLIFSVVACSHKPKPSDEQFKFVTHINQSGLKQFQFSLQSPSSKKNNFKGGRGGGRGGIGQRERGGGQSKNRRGHAEGSVNRNEENHEKMRNNLYRKLEQHLAKTGYCKEGFVETDLYSEAGHILMKGRCNDKASADDRVRFRNL